MPDKPPDDKDGLLEMLKKLWLPVAGFIGAVTLAYNFYQLWLGDQTTVTYFLAGGGLLVLVIALLWVGFSKKIITHDAAKPFDPKRKESVPRYSKAYQWIARISLVLIILAIAGGIRLLMGRQQELQQVQQVLQEKVIVVVAAFDGPEQDYGIHRQIMEELSEATKSYDDTIILESDQLITSRDSARKLGEQEKADLVIWAWYRPTENPNITVHIENISATEITVIKESEIYQPQATLADLESFEIQKKISSETSMLLSFLTGMLRYKSGDYQTAIERFEQVLGKNDIFTLVKSYDLYLNLGNTYIELDNYERAIQEYDKAIEIDPQDAEAYSNRALAYYYLEQYEQAIQDNDKAIELDPNLAWAYGRRGVAYHKLGQYERAMQEYDKAIELDPNYALAYGNRGLAYHKLEQYERGIQDYDKAIELDPNLAWAYGSRGLTYYTLEQYERAIQEYDKAIELDPNDAAAYDNRGLAYQKLGKTTAAEADFKKYEELTGDAVAFVWLIPVGILIGTVILWRLFQRRIQQSNR